MPIILLLRVSFGTFPVPGITEKKNQICVYMCICIYIFLSRVDCSSDSSKRERSYDQRVRSIQGAKRFIE